MFITNKGENLGLFQVSKNINEEEEENETQILDINKEDKVDELQDKIYSSIKYYNKKQNFTAKRRKAKKLIFELNNTLDID